MMLPGKLFSVLVRRSDRYWQRRVQLNRSQPPAQQQKGSNLSYSGFASGQGILLEVESDLQANLMPDFFGKGLAGRRLIDAVAKDLIVVAEGNPPALSAVMDARPGVVNDVFIVPEVNECVFRSAMVF